MLHHYGVDLLDVGSRRLSWRRLYNLVERLPLASHTGRAIQGEAVEWGHAEHLLASVFEAVESLNYTLQVVNTPKGKARPKKPTPMARPGQRHTRHRSELSPADMARRLRAMQEREAARGR